MIQQTLFEKPLPFGGKTFNYAKDSKRLTTQFYRVKQAMLTGEWFTLRGLQEIVGGTETSMSARIRDLRKEAFGGYEVETRRDDKGVFEYRIKQP